MNCSFRFDNPNMDCEDAKLGMRQAARDLKSEELPNIENWALYPARINRHSAQAFRTAAWMRGYLLIALLKQRLDRRAADRVARTLMRDHYVIDWFPESWLTEATVRYPKVNDLVRAALRYQLGQ